MLTLLRATHDGTIVASGGEWREFVIHSAQEEASGDVRKHLPQTCALLEDVLPGAVAMAKIGLGEIIFSALGIRLYAQGGEGIRLYAQGCAGIRLYA